MKIQKHTASKKVDKIISRLLVYIIFTIGYIICLIYLSNSYNKVKINTEILRERESINNSIERSQFSGKKVYIATRVETLGVIAQTPTSNGESIVETRYGEVEFRGNRVGECITVYVDINGRIDWIGNISNNKYIEYVIDGYEKINDRTIIIASKTNKEKYREYVDLLVQRDEIDFKIDIISSSYRQQYITYILILTIIYSFVSFYLILRDRSLVKKNGS